MTAFHITPCVRVPFRYHALMLALFLSPIAGADDYFDPAFLGGSAVDLSAFTQPGGVAEGEYQVTVYMNQQSTGEEATFTFKKNAKGDVVPSFSPEQLATWGVNVNSIPALKALDPSAAVINDLSAYIPAATVALNLGALRLDISVPQVAMDPQYSNWANPRLWQDGIPALLANYTVSGGQTTSRYGGISQRTENFFASVFMGANAGAWRLRSTMNHSQSHTQTSGEGRSRSYRNTQFSNSTLSRDIKHIFSSLSMGETMTGSEIIDGVSFKGIRLRSSEQMLPSQLRGFSPAITGVANSNARITVRQNGNVVYETYVAPGPFDIRDIQQAGLSGDYDVTITEADGVERKFTVPYSSLPMLVRPAVLNMKSPRDVMMGTSQTAHVILILFY